MTDLQGLALVISAVLTPLSVLGLAWMNRRDANKAAVKVEEVKETAAAQASVLEEVAETTKTIHGLVNSDMTKALKGQLAALQSQLYLLRHAGDVVNEDSDLVSDVKAQIRELEVALAQRAQTAQDMENGTSGSGGNG